MKSSSVAHAIAVFEKRLAAGTGSSHSEKKNELYAAAGPRASGSNRRSSLAFPLPEKDFHKERATHAMKDANDKIGTIRLKGPTKECMSTLRRRNSLVVVPAAPKCSTTVGTVGNQFCSIGAPYSAPSSPPKVASSRPHRRSSITPSSRHQQKSMRRDSMVVKAKNSSLQGGPEECVSTPRRRGSLVVVPVSLKSTAMVGTVRSQSFRSITPSSTPTSPSKLVGTVRRSQSLRSIAPSRTLSSPSKLVGTVRRSLSLRSIAPSRTLSSPSKFGGTVRRSQSFRSIAPSSSPSSPSKLVGTVRRSQSFRSIAPSTTPPSPSKLVDPRPHRRSSMTTMEHQHQQKSLCRYSLGEEQNSSLQDPKNVPTLRRRSSLVVVPAVPKSSTVAGTVGSPFRSIPPYTTLSSPSTFLSPRPCSSMTSSTIGRVSKVEAKNSSLQGPTKECVPTLRRRNSLVVVSATPESTRMVGTVGSQLRSIAAYSAPLSHSNFVSPRPHRRSSMASMYHKKSTTGRVSKKVETKTADQSWSSLSPTKTTRSGMPARETITSPVPFSCNVGIRTSNEASGRLSASECTSPKGHYVMHQVRRKAFEPSLQCSTVNREYQMPVTTPRLRRHSIVGSAAGVLEKSQSSNKRAAPARSRSEAKLAGNKEPKPGNQSPIAKIGRRSSATSTAVATKSSPHRRESSLKKRSDLRITQAEQINWDDSFGVDSLADITAAFFCSSPSPLKSDEKAVVSRIPGLRNRTLHLSSTPPGRNSTDRDNEREKRAITSSHEQSPLRPSHEGGLSFDGSGPMIDAVVSIARELSIGSKNEDCNSHEHFKVSPLRSCRQWGLSFDGSGPLVDAAISMAAEHSEDCTVHGTFYDHAMDPPPLRPIGQLWLSFNDGVSMVDVVAEKRSPEAGDANSTNRALPTRPVREMRRPVRRNPNQSTPDESLFKKPDPSSSFLETTTASTTASIGLASSASGSMSSDDDNSILPGDYKIVKNDEQGKEDDAISSLTVGERRFPAWDDLLRSRQRANRKQADERITKICSGNVSIKDRLIQFQRRGPDL
jgi:hypothetical protein